MNTLVSSNIRYFEEFSHFPLPHVVEIYDEIDTDTAKHVTAVICRAVASKQPFLPVVLNSTGGNSYDALHVVDALANAGIPVYTIGMGLIASGAALIFTCGKERWIAPSARFMVHDVSVDIDGNLTGASMRVEANEMSVLKEAVCAMMAKNIGVAPDYFIKMMHEAGNVDIYKSADECLQQKIATHIGVPKLSIHVQVSMTLTGSVPVLALPASAQSAPSDDVIIWSMQGNAAKRRKTTATEATDDDTDDE